MWLTNIPVVLIWLWFALRARALFFFSAVNPAIETGGVLGESKMDILNQIPKKYLPKTIFIKVGTPSSEILAEVLAESISYPLIAKPNIGERGTLVSKIENKEALLAYANANQLDFLIQEFIGLKMELAVMHHRMPGGEGKVTSICIKEPLNVKGDGKSTIRKLMATYPRAVLQLPRFEKDFPHILDQIPAAGEKIELEPIGNHSRGTKFLNGNHLIEAQVHEVFNDASKDMEGIYYGRFDMKCESPEALLNGEFKVMEYNGVAAEPAHIYDPSYPLFKKYRDIYRHWKIIFEIYKVQKKRGVKSMNLEEVIQSVKEYWRYQKSIE